MGARSFAARLARLDAALTRFEAVLCVVVIALEIAAFSFWIALKGLATPSEGKEYAGLVFRATLGAIAVGLAAHAALRGRAPGTRALGAFGGVMAGAALGFVMRNAGTSYFANGLNWLQDASSLTLLGGLRGVGTELTWWLAMLGGSLATGGGKHIHIDVVLRFLRPKLRLPAVAVGWIAAAAVCFAGVWGFFDHIAIESFGAPAAATAAEKIEVTLGEGSRHFFLLRKQVGLDIATSFHVLAGEPYDGWLSGSEWNEWVRKGGWEHHFSKGEVERILLSDDAEHQLHSPLVVMPSGGNVRGLLARDLHLIFPFGLLVIGARFLLRVLLAFFNIAPAEDVLGDELPEPEAPSP